LKSRVEFFWPAKKRSAWKLADPERNEKEDKKGKKQNTLRTLVWGRDAGE